MKNWLMLGVGCVTALLVAVVISVGLSNSNPDRSRAERLQSKYDGEHDGEICVLPDGTEYPMEWSTYGHTCEELQEAHKAG